MWPEAGRLGIAVSGGPDSVALLALCRACLPAGQFEAATIDHGLRAGSAAEAAMVARLCSDWSIPHRTLAVTVAGGNLQDAARDARYRALMQWAGERGIEAIATAHHADDQAETLLMRLNRGSGLGGLAGIRPRGLAPHSHLPLVRPLLDWRRDELAAIAASSGADSVQDPSNEDPRFDRVRLRKQLAGCDWLSTPALARSAAHLADAEDALEWATAREWAEAVSAGPDILSYRPCAPHAVRLRVLKRVLAHFGGSARGGELARLLDRLEHGRGGTLGGVLARAGDDGWVFSPEPARGPR